MPLGSDCRNPRIILKGLQYLIRQAQSYKTILNITSTVD
ncbi:hypothetical protein TH15OA1_530340 [Vibrio harveyi]|nr:hypothetical protein TH15OA1_530340 [Vibrio harveyi]